MSQNLLAQRFITFCRSALGAHELTPKGSMTNLGSSLKLHGPSRKILELKMLWNKKMSGISRQGIKLCLHKGTCDQTWKKFLFVRKSIFGVEKSPQLQIVPRLIKLQFFPLYQIFSSQKRLIVDNNADLCALIGKNCNKIVVYTKMFTIISKIVCKHCLHACYFFHVCLVAMFDLHVEHC